ncbi:collagen alpha-1(III) chain-like isoform X2 [Malaclemys terrapin pileata]|uniref:collagen alpha-1(III) chain-like isoform X2 n=1 Tax=Malaclemys terrapin pileata TaxID=2991368 RepID=UPI0023A81A75|nr:collagen alpha-1(III) chain-like isoform X2 [Malaclemys terrapin pileata]
MAESDQGARCTQAGGREGAGESPGGVASSEPGQRAGAEPGASSELGQRAGAEPGASSEPGQRAGAEPGGCPPGRGADPSPAEWRGPALVAWFLSLLAKGPEASSRRDRPAGEPDTPMPQLGANSARGAAGTAQELRKTAERLQAQLEALKGSSDPETLEFLQALEAPIRIASRVLTENQRLRRELEELKGRLAAPRPLEPARQPPAPWASSPWATRSTGPCEREDGRLREPVLGPGGSAPRGPGHLPAGRGVRAALQPPAAALLPDLVPLGHRHQQRPGGDPRGEEEDPGGAAPPAQRAGRALRQQQAGGAALRAPEHRGRLLLHPLRLLPVPG